MIDKIDGQSMDLVKENVEKLKELFPSIVKEDKIDFEELELLLGENINRNKEQYSFTWNGKTEATKLAQKRSTGTLRPCIEESKDWGTTQNLYIEGDNLEVLRLLQASYNGRIKMIYIDPPYNTGHDFVYKDNFEDNIKNYKDQTGQSQKSNADTDGRYHTNWLNMMYPRLKLARNLLTDDGVIFISMQDEISNLLKICTEIFGEQNIEILVWKKKGGASNTEKLIGTLTEFIVCCFKKKNAGCFNYKIIDRTFRFKDEKGEFNLEGIEKTNLGTYERMTMQFAIKDPKTNKEFYPSNNMRWTLGKETVQKLIEEGKIYFDYKNNKVKRIKRKEDYDCSQNVFYNLLLEEGSLSSAKDECEKLLGNREIFDTPKPITLIITLLKMGGFSDSLILDFFSGSATTAHAVMQLNAEDGGNRKFICVQLPELTDENSEAYRTGYKNICEIGKERIRRAGKKIVASLKDDMDYESKDWERYTRLGNPITNLFYTIKDENGENKNFVANQQDSKDFYKFNPDKLDIGFKVFKLDSSNLKKWNNTPTKDVGIIQNRIQTSIEYIKDDRTELDLVYEVMLKYGIDLTLPITKTQNDKAYIIEAPEYKLLVCTYPNLTIEDIEDFANESVGTYLFADRCFNTDNLLVNAEEILKSRNKEMRLF